MTKKFDPPGFLKCAFDAMPAMVMLVGSDAEIFFRNLAAEKLIGSDAPYYDRRAGEILHCIHSADSPEGCGRGAFCKDCVIRNSVTSAFKGGAVHRVRAVFERIADGAVEAILMLITVSPFEFEGCRMAVLAIEDVSELMELRALLPICSSCKRIKNEKNYCERVETYVKQHLADVKFSHGLCPDCARKLYPGQMDK